MQYLFARKNHLPKSFSQSRVYRDVGAMVMTFFIVGLLLTAVVQSGYGMHTGLHRQRMTDIGQPLANYVGWIRQAEGIMSLLLLIA